MQGDKEFLQLPLSCNGKNSVYQFLNLDCAPDQHQNQMFFASETSHC